MTSLMTSPRQMSQDGGYFVPLADLTGLIYARTEPTTTSSGINGGTFSCARWAATYYAGQGFGTSGNPFRSSINAPGAGILRDMGRTVVSANRTFRKIQLVSNKHSPNSTFSTFGVAGQASTTPTEDYLTGYIELGFEGNGLPAPVARFGR